VSELLSLLEVAAPLATGGVGAAIAKERAPRTWWATVGLPLTLGRIQHSYAEVMEACGLAVEPQLWRAISLPLRERYAPEQRIRPKVPRVLRVAPTATGLRLRLRLAKGLETAQVQAASEKLRHAWGVHGIYVSEVRPGVVELRLVGFDLLRQVRMPARASAKGAGLLRVPVALREDGTVFFRDFRSAPHALNVGATESGKSMMQRSILTALARRSVALVGIDCKKGVELSPFAPRLSALATEPDAAGDLVGALLDVMEGRYDLIRQHQGISSKVAPEDITSDIWGLPEGIRPVPVVVMIDEIAELFLIANAKQRDALVNDLVRFAQLARAAGMFLEVAGQRFGSDLGKGATALRAQLTGRYCHRVNDEASAKMALGDISEQAVKAATWIPPKQPGTAIVGDTSGAWSRVRTPNIPLRDAVAVCRDTAHLTPDIPELAAFRPMPAVPAPAPALVPAPAPATP
jgi:S-DNA-T family DNA segregation ATPase FtsK/SpoIIIE